MKLSLAPAEGRVMKCIWESDEDLTVLEITERIRERYDKEYANNTVATFLKILENKGFVSRYKRQHSYQYHAEVAQEDFTDAQVKALRDEWYGGSAYELAAALLKVSGIPAEQIQKWKALVEEYGESPGSAAAEIG